MAEDCYVNKYQTPQYIEKDNIVTCKISKKAYGDY